MTNIIETKPVAISAVRIDLPSTLQIVCRPIQVQFNDGKDLYTKAIPYSDFGQILDDIFPGHYVKVMLAHYTHPLSKDTTRHLFSIVLEVKSKLVEYIDTSVAGVPVNEYPHAGIVARSTEANSIEKIRTGSIRGEVAEVHDNRFKIISGTIYSVVHTTGMVAMGTWRVNYTDDFNLFDHWMGLAIKHQQTPDMLQAALAELYPEVPAEALSPACAAIPVTEIPTFSDELEDDHCETCRHWGPIHDDRMSGVCYSPLVFAGEAVSDSRPDTLENPDDDGCGASTGPKFGCVHWELKL